MNWKRTIFVGYTNTMQIISQSGIARALLPLVIRKRFGRLLKAGIKNLTQLTNVGPYDVLGNRMWLDMASPSALDMVYGTYERDTVNALKKVLKPGMTFVDVGAHVGFYTLLAARLVGAQGRVYAFEPNPGIFHMLTRNVEENGYQDIVRLIPKAVSNREGKARLFVPEGESGEATLFPSSGGKGQDIEVESTTLDSFFAQEAWPNVDLIKVDVEGAEVEVLEGMRELARKSKGLKLIVEFNPGNQIRSHGSHAKLFDALIALGFCKFYAIRHGLKAVEIPNGIEKLIRMTETTRYVNILCER